MKATYIHAIYAGRVKFQIFYIPMHYYELQPIKFFLFDECFAMRSDKFLVLCIYNEKAYALGAIVIQFAPCYDRQMDIG